MPPAGCSVAGQKAWLQGCFSEWHFWYRLARNPNPLAYAATADHSNALLCAGGESAPPVDLWSNLGSTEIFNRFFGDGRTVGYGVSAARLELGRGGALPHRVRHVEPRYPATDVIAQAGAQPERASGGG